jgi:predicted DCC family thiol-disulfide oxidoreductase YuxK
MVERPTILFDGVCNLCNRSVRFVLARDPAERFAFAPLQSAQGRELLTRVGLPADARASIVLVEGKRAFEKSDAVLRVLAGLSGLWPILALLRVIPRRLRDAIYDWIAANRYRWFGQRAECPVPTPEQRRRFLA